MSQLTMLSGRHGKNIDITEKMKRESKAIKSEKLGKRAFVFQIHHKGVKFFFTFYVRGVNIFLLAKIGGLKIFAMSF